MAFTNISDGTVVMRPKTRRLADLAGSLTRPGQPKVTVEDMNPFKATTAATATTATKRQSDKATKRQSDLCDEQQVGHRCVSHRTAQREGYAVTIAIDTHMLVRLLVRDDEAQYAAARQWVDDAAAAEEPVLIVLGALLETEWVLRSRYKLDKASIAGTFTALLESADVEFEHPLTVEEALYG